MGLFSWITSDTLDSIPAKGSVKDTFPVYLLQPDGLPPLEELDYEGYGMFGGVDVYEWVARMNHSDHCSGDVEEDRMIGIDLACHDEDNSSLEYPIKLVRDRTLRYEDVMPSITCPDQGYFYPEPEEEWDEDAEKDFYITDDEGHYLHMERM